MVQAAETRELARADLVDRWDAERIAAPDQSRIILTHTNAEVRDLNLAARSEEHTSELQSLMRISYAVFCLKKKTNHIHTPPHSNTPNNHTTTLHNNPTTH